MSASKPNYYYFAGEDMVQNFQSNPSKIDETVLQTVEESQSLVVPTMKQTLTSQPGRDKPQDLGKDVFDYLKGEYLAKHKVTTNDSVSLFSMWDLLRIRQKNDRETREREREKREDAQYSHDITHNTTGDKRTLTKDTQDRLYKTTTANQQNVQAKKVKRAKVQSVLSFQKDDVMHTLRLWEEHAQQTEQARRKKQAQTQQLIEMGRKL